MKVYSINEIKDELIGPEEADQRKAYENSLKEAVQKHNTRVRTANSVDKCFLLLVDIQGTAEANHPHNTATVWYMIQEIEYKHVNAIEAVDIEAAIDYCDKVLGINPYFIV